MTVIGNIFLFFSTLVFAGMLSMQIGKPIPRGEALVGYGWTMILLNLVFAICISVAVIAVTFIGGFDWVPARKPGRAFWVVTTLLTALLSFAASSFFRYEPGPVPFVIRIYSTSVQYLIPVLLIGVCAVLLNTHLRTAVPFPLVKWSAIIVTAIGIAGTTSILVEWIAASVRHHVQVIANVSERQDANHLRILADIEACDVMKSMGSILVFTGDNQPRDIMQKAVAKVKTNPDWEQELLLYLQSDWAPEVFQFLASNPVDNPARFVGPVREGVLIQARLIRERIRSASHPSNFYPGMFTWEVERVLRTVDRFKGMGVDYRPAVRQVRAALDEHSDYEKPKFRCITMLDKWMKANP